MNLLLKGRKAAISAGLTMIIMGLLVFIFPKFFAYIFAGIVVLIGGLLLLSGLLSGAVAKTNERGHQQEYSSYEEVKD